MDQITAFFSILDSPNNPKGYRELRKYYLDKGMSAEASAISHLIESRFEKKHAAIDNTFPDQERREDASGDN